MNNRLIIDQTTNTLIGCRHVVLWERVDYLIIPHHYNGMQIDHIGPHCFDGLNINLLCIEEGVKSLEDCALENAWVLNVKLPRGLKIGERCFANSQLTDILLPRDLHIIKKETFLNCENLEAVYAYFGVNTISYNAFKGCKNLKEAHFRIVKSIRDGAFEGCRNLETLDLGYQVKQLGNNLFKGCDSLESLQLRGSFDKLDKETFAGAEGLQFLTLWTNADSLYFPPDGFQDTYLQELSLHGDFEPIVKSRSCFPEDVAIKVPNLQKPHLALGYFFAVYPIV